MVSSEASQAPESYESKGGDIKFFFMGKVSTGDMVVTQVQIFLARLGIYKDILYMSKYVEGSNLFLVDGETIHLEPPCVLKLYNVSGFGIPYAPVCSMILRTIKGYIFSDFNAIDIQIGSCESYEIQNVTRI